MNSMRTFNRRIGLLMFWTLLSHGTAQGADKAVSLVNQLNPINIALGPLIDDAISDGNEALAQRLEQLRKIIQETLFNRNKIIQDRTTL